jgi:hypothetical protein
MISTGNESDDYLPDSDDSYDEDERPNQWKGHPSTWRQLNSAEIDTYTALNEIRNQDLSLHLYNAFALKNGHENAEGKASPKPAVNKVFLIFSYYLSSGHTKANLRDCRISMS